MPHTLYTFLVIFSLAICIGHLARGYFSDRSLEAALKYAAIFSALSMSLSGYGNLMALLPGEVGIAFNATSLGLGAFTALGIYLLEYTTPPSPTRKKIPAAAGVFVFNP